ncbi:unnamed protein product [Peronospora belbahrii]|uniref:Uncharacterized protein n=1 Tax=Peronospora belbahrii TaxID=622444 RepID=A0AAU9LMR9_9STRA|nr:unnamed protein product [Peronospora belbahrii]CAH0515989.1 unnamed protein product [Peronospora belbahrii]
MQMPPRASNLQDTSFFSLPTVDSTRASNSATTTRLLTRHQVESVLVSGGTPRRQGTAYYTLDVYTTTPTGTPNDFLAACSKINDDVDQATARKPAYQVQKSLADFDKLRRALYNSSQLAHRSVSCEYCTEVIQYLGKGDKGFGSSTLRMLTGRDKIRRSLQEFVDVALDILIHFACSEGTPWCSAQVQSHQLMRQFLLPRASDA